MNFFRLLRGLFVLLCVTFLPACSPQPVDCAQGELFCVGVVTAAGGIDDHGLNQGTWEALQNIQTQVPIARLDHIESVDSRDWQKNILFFTDHGYDVIVTVGTSIGGTMAEVAYEYPGTFFIGVDQESDTAQENVATIYFPENQAGFLSGMLASMVSQTERVGAICETSGIEVVWQYCEGFRAGAVYAREDIDVIVVYRDDGDRDKTFNDPEWGKQQLLRLVNNGVDTMTGFGGNTAQGAFLAANEEDVLIIGSAEDLYFRMPEVQSTLVTSVYKYPDAELSSLILMAFQGNPISGAQAGGFRYAPFRLPQFQTDLELKSNLENAFQGIRDGEIEVTLPEKK